MIVFCLVATVTATGVASVSEPSGAPIDENVYVQTSDITGANTVKVIFERTGPDAGLYGVWVTYTVRFNWGSSNEKVEAFQKYLGPWETVATEYVAGPIPTADAEVIDVQLDYDI